MNRNDLIGAVKIQICNILSVALRLTERGFMHY